MAVEGDSSRDLAALVVQLVGGLSETGERYEPYRLVDADGTVVEPVASYFRDLLAAGRAESTVRSYGMDLLRWFRFLWAVGIVWDRASRVEARDFSRWLQVAGKPSRPHWRVRGLAAEAGGAGVEDETGAPDGAGDCWLVCGLFCPYPVGTRPGANSKLLATINSAGISFLRSILLITTP